MNKPLFLFVGRSSSGKTTAAEALGRKYGYKQVSSYTTRTPRYEGESGHTFITEEEFNNLNNLVAYTFYNNAHYGTTSQQLDECEIYVVDVPGVEALLDRYQTNRPIVIIYFDATVYIRINRMIDRGDSDMGIIARLLQDEKDDWYKQLDSLVWHYEHIKNRDIQLYSVNANGSRSDVLEMALYYMRRHMEEE